VPVIQPASINTPVGLAALKAFNADLLVVAAYGQILKPEVIAAASHGAINVHASLLPKYRGASPIAHAILNGETRTGVTIIRITPGLDAGDMLAQEAVDIGPSETTGELEARLAPLGAKLCLDVIQRMKAGPVSGIKQDPALVTKAPKLKKEHGLIDWSQSAERIANHIRAMQPWPTAYTFFHRPGKELMRVIVNVACEFPVRFDPSVTPGSLFTDSKFPTTFFVAAGEVTEGKERSVVEVYELQPAGKKRMTAEEFLRGYPIQDGYRFGPEVLA
jgi:methionyl-tRNA formyltransferase